MIEDLLFVAALGKLLLQLLFLILGAMAIMAAALLAVSVMAPAEGPVIGVEPDEGFPTIKGQDWRERAPYP